MPDDFETIASCVTVIGGDRLADDYQVIWRELPIGRIMKSSGRPHDEQQWEWNCYIYGRPTRDDESGTADTLNECKAEFKTASARIRAELTDKVIAQAHRIAKASAEALARYDRKRDRPAG
jgi:hypothetical protein